VAPTKLKGDLAELKVAAHLLELGYRIAIPYGEDWDYDLILIRGDAFERVQVKHATSDGRVIDVRCSSQSLTNGKVKRTKRYTSALVDWIAVYDATTSSCHYVPAEMLGTGRRHFSLRLVPAMNGQRLRIHNAADFRIPEPHTRVDGASRTRTDALSDANRTL
jgi:PD-(D/E)XK nuclease superfamily protein